MTPKQEAQREYHARWRAANPERARFLNRRWREANRERLIESQRLWRNKNRDKVRDGNRKRMASEYGVFLEARRRCNDPSRPDYKNYGARGIQFRFTSFKQFMSELGPRPAGPLGSGPWQSLTLDRINNDGHYEPGNVRWATRSEQERNKRRRF